MTKAELVNLPSLRYSVHSIYIVR